MMGSLVFHSPRSLTRVAVALAGAALLPLSSCNKHVFEVVPRDCTAELKNDTPIALDVPADILIVVDNSGSMCEEQKNLVDNFFDPDCPIDVNDVQPEYRNPSDALVAELADRCGFVQLLAAYDNDWRLGVITTDVGPCDDRYNIAEDPALKDFSCSKEVQPGWGRRPQRGCLQPFDIADRANSRVLERGDEDVGQKFANILANVKTFGSAYERGLDAMEVFLDKDSTRAPGCADDLDAFLRPDAKLVVIFLTDEDDCSHADGQFGLDDENAGESCDNETEVPPQTSTELCYSKLDELTPTKRYSDFLRSYKGDVEKVSVAVISGALVDDNGELSAAGCTISPQGTPLGGCFESRGNSNKTGQGQVCDPATTTCCTADPGSRYIQFARELGPNRYLNDSICFASFRNTMLDIAKFIAAPNQVRLAERPASPGAIVVEIVRQGESKPEQIRRIPDDEDTTGQSGWQYDGDVTITFYGTSVPRPGDKITVNALARPSEEQVYCTSPADADVDAGASSP
ncbi:MAG: hypothetical protein ACO3JL_01100 [Myxococcota bacterium]